MKKEKRSKIVICSGKGGVGKSMLASALAVLFARDKKIIAVDCDVDAPNLAIWLGGVRKWDKAIKVFASARPEIDFKKCNGCGLCAEKCYFGAIEIIKGKPRVNPFLCEGCGACEVLCPQRAIKMKTIQNAKILIKNTKYGFPLISGQLFVGETGSGKIVTEIKKEAEKFDYDIQIIDSAPGTGCPVIASLQDSNFVILITESTPSGFSDLKRVLKVVNHFNIPYGVVVNKWDLNENLSRRIKKWANRKFLGKISYDKKIFQSIANLVPIMETDLKAKREIESIFERINSFTQ